MKEEGNINLGMVTDSPLHWATGIVMLDSESNIGYQSAIIFRNSTLNLQIKHHKNPKKRKEKKKQKVMNKIRGKRRKKEEFME